MTEIVEKSWDLSLYELHRTPQEAITDTTEIAVSPKSLQSELTCPICLDMLTSTMTTKECLHRFCAECIITALRSGNKECPTCRKKLVSKRSLRPDPNFDQLVSKIFPDREEYEEQQEKVLAILSKNHSQQLMSTIGDAIKAQAAHVKMINRKKNLSDYDELLASHCQVGDGPHNEPMADDDTVPYRPKKKRKAAGENGEGPSASALLPDEVEIIFKPHTSVESGLVERLGDNQTRFIKTNVTASIDHLCQYLRTRLGMELGLGATEVAENSDNKESETTNGDTPEDAPEDEEGAEKKKIVPGDMVINLRIHVCQNPGQYVELTGPETLEMVLEDYWKVAKPIELHYEFEVVD